MELEADSQKTKVWVYLFVFSITFYASIQVINWQFRNLSSTILGIVELTCIVSMLFCGRKLFNEFEFESHYFKFIYFLFFTYQIVIISRGIPHNYPTFKYNLQSDFLLWPSIIPLAVFMGKNDHTFFYFIKSFYFLCIGFLLFSLINPFLITQRITAETYVHTFAFTSAFLLLNERFVSKKVSVLAFISLIVAILSFTYLARRNGIASYVGLLSMGLYFIVRRMNVSTIIKLFPIVVGAVILLLLATQDFLPKITGKLNERLNEDTRSDVFFNFFKGMKDDMIFGKGLNGSYYSPISEVLTDDGVVYGEVEYRNVIENGYLQLLLTGGYINIVLFLLVMLPAALLGVFKSSNQLSRACGIIIFLWLVDMTVYGMPRLVMQYVLVWMAVGVCYQKSYRQMTDEEIQVWFKEVGLI